MIFLPEHVAAEYAKRCSMYPDLPSEIVLREMAMDGVL
jgi:hypothetical protein